MSSSYQFKSFPKEWKILPFLEAVNDVTGGNTKIKQTDALKTGIHPVIDQGKQECCGYVDDDEALCKEELPTILFGDHTKIIKFIDYPFVLGADGVKVLSPKIPMDKKFLFYFLKTIKLPENAGYSRHYKFLKDAIVPIPPLAEQIRIAAILDKADSLRRKNQQAIQLADQFLLAVFLELFGDPLSWTKQNIPLDWQEQPIGKIAHLKRGYDLPIQSRNVGKVPIYAANGVVGYHDEAKTQGPGVVTGRSGTLGTVMYSKGSFWPLNTSLYVTDFFGNEPRYIQWFLKFYKLDRYNRGAGVPTLNRNLFLEEISFVPPKELQVKFVEIFDKVSAILSKTNDSSGVELFDALSQKAFAGEL